LVAASSTLRLCVFALKSKLRRRVRAWKLAKVSAESNLMQLTAISRPV
jgi:hypothetical protein